MPIGLRAHQAAAYLGIGVSTLWRWAKERPGFPQPLHLGDNTTAWVREDLDAWFAAQRAAAQEETC